MIVIGNTLVSEEIIDNDFVCNLSRCKGACCEQGDYGAPLENNEAKIIRAGLKHIIPYLNKQSIATIEKQGVSVRDPQGDLVTVLNTTCECSFAIKENGMWKCGIEKAFNAGKIDFRKPVSCHLYPIRLSQVGEYTALNYDRWDICSDACKLGEQLKVPVYKFLKEPLIRRFGEKWYNELDKIAGDYLQAGEF